MLDFIFYIITTILNKPKLRKIFAIFLSEMLTMHIFNFSYVAYCNNS